MSRYRGPCFKKIRRLGALPGLTKIDRDDLKKKGKYDAAYFNKLKGKEYHIRLREKQKVRFHYGLTDRQLLKYVRIAAKAKGSTAQILLQLLEMRLDNILFRLGMARTIPAARQLVNHRHILVNGRLVDIPSYRCKPLDTITAKDKQKSKALIQNYLDSLPPKVKVPPHLTLNRRESEGVVKRIIDRNRVGLKINEFKIVEYYSRQTKT